MSQRHYGLQLKDRVMWQGQEYTVVELSGWDNNRCWIQDFDGAKIMVTCEEVAYKKIKS